MSGAFGREEKIRFNSGGFQLSGTLHLPGAIRPPIIIGSHGLLADSNSPKQLALANASNKLGFAYFRFDYRGCGASGGRFELDTALEGRCEDLKNAVSLLRDRPDLGSAISLFGSSFGGTVSLCVAAQMDIRSLVSFAAPVQSRHVRGVSASPVAEYRYGIAEPQTVPEFDITHLLGNHHHIFVVHGESDEIVPVSDAVLLHGKSKPPKKLWIQDQGDHRMSMKRHQMEFVAMASKWFDDTGVPPG